MSLHNAALDNKLENNLQQKLETGPVKNEAVLLNKRNSREFAQNPLDRNGDGKVDANDFVGGRRLSRGYDASLPITNTTYVQTAQRSSVLAQPTVLETIQKDVVVHERLHPIQKEEIQPIIYREREQLDVKQVTQMMHETQIQPTLIQQRELPAERREAVVQRGAVIQENVVLPLREVDATLRTQVVHAPIVNEVIKKTVIEEIQPVLERDVIQTTVIQNTQPIHEKVVEAPRVFRETTTVGDRRLSRGDMAALNAQGFQVSQAAGTFALEQPAFIQSEKRASVNIQSGPAQLETIQKDVVIHERIHPVQKEEIQPIIYREREQLDVKQVTQMMHETQIQPTLIQQRELPAQRREAVVERGAAIQENIVLPTREVDATLRTQVVHAPIVNEVIKKTVIEEIQPVLERDIIQSTVIQNTKPIYEKIVEAPSVYRETVVISQDRGIVGGSLAELEAQGFNLGLTGRRLSQTYSQTTISQGLNAQGLNSLDRNGDGVVDARDFAGQTTTTYTTTTTSGLPSETLVTSHGLKRRSLKEALPNSYGYLGETLDGKIVQDELLRGNNAATSSLAPKTVL